MASSELSHSPVTTQPLTIWPVPTGQWLSASTVLLLACGAWVTFGSALTYVSLWSQWPMITSFVIWIMFCGHFNDNHRVQVDTASV